jgi:hypothetical protein
LQILWGAQLWWLRPSRVQTYQYLRPKFIIFAGEELTKVLLFRLKLEFYLCMIETPQQVPAFSLTQSKYLSHSKL